MKPTPLIVFFASPADDLALEQMSRLHRLLELEAHRAQVFIYHPDIMTPVTPQAIAQALEKLTKADDWPLSHESVLAHFRALADRSVLIAEPQKTPIQPFPKPKALTLQALAAPTAKLGLGRKNDPRLAPRFRR